APAVPGAQNAEYRREAAAPDAVEDEGARASGLRRADLCRRTQARARSHREVHRPVSRRDGVLGTGPRGVCHVFAVPRGASPADSHDESTRAPQRRKPPADESHPAIPNRALVPRIVICELDHGIEALARDPDDRVGREALAPTPRRDRSPDERGSRCVTRPRRQPTPWRFYRRIRLSSNDLYVG